MSPGIGSKDVDTWGVLTVGGVNEVFYLLAFDLNSSHWGLWD